MLGAIVFIIFAVVWFMPNYRINPTTGKREPEVRYVKVGKGWNAKVRDVKAGKNIVT